MDLGGILVEGKEKVFLISTTHGGETNAIRAGIKTIQEFKDKDVITHIHSIGNELIKKVNALIAENKLSQYIEVIPCPWMVSFIFKDKEQKICNGYRTYFMQEMIKENILFQGIIVPSLSFSDKEMNHFLDGFESCIKKYKAILSDGYKNHLIGTPTKAVFRKFN